MWPLPKIHSIGAKAVQGPVPFGLGHLALDTVGAWSRSVLQGPVPFGLGHLAPYSACGAPKS